MTKSHLQTPLLQHGNSDKVQNHPTVILMDQCMFHCRGLVCSGVIAYFFGFWGWSAPFTVHSSAARIDGPAELLASQVMGMIWGISWLFAGYHLAQAVRLLLQLYRTYEPARTMVKSLVGAYSCGPSPSSSSWPLFTTQMQQDLQQVLKQTCCCASNADEMDCCEDDFCCVEKPGQEDQPLQLEMEPEDSIEEGDGEGSEASSILIV